MWTFITVLKIASQKPPRQKMWNRPQVQTAISFTRLLGLLALVLHFVQFNFKMVLLLYQEFEFDSCLVVFVCIRPPVLLTCPHLFRFAVISIQATIWTTRHKHQIPLSACPTPDDVQYNFLFEFVFVPVLCTHNDIIHARLLCSAAAPMCFAKVLCCLT